MITAMSRARGAVVLMAMMLIGAGRAASQSFCTNCVLLNAGVQTGSLSVTSGTFAGLLTAGAITTPSFSASTITANVFYGSGTYVTNLNASQLLSGTVPSARMSGAYAGITGIGTIASGVWNGSPVATQYGGTGKNWVNVSTAAIPYFTGTGTMGVLNSPSFYGVLVEPSQFAAPVWVSSPALQGYNFADVPLTSLIGDALPTHIIVSTNSIPLTNGPGVIGNISGGAAFLTAPMAISNLIPQTLPTSIAASSVTAISGLKPITVGGASLIPQFHVDYDGRISTAAQFVLVVPPATIQPGPLPAGVTISAAQITTGTTSAWIASLSSITANAFFGDGSHLTNVAGTFLGGAVPNTTTFASSVTIKSASGLLVGGPVTATTYYGSGANLTGITGTFAGGTVPGESDFLSSVTFHSASGTKFNANVNIGGNLTNTGTLTVTGISSLDGGGIITNGSGAMTSVSSITAGTFYGDGSHLTNVPSTSWTGGTVPNESDFISSVTMHDKLEVDGDAQLHKITVNTINVNGNLQTFQDSTFYGPVIVAQGYQLHVGTNAVAGTMNVNTQNKSQAVFINAGGDYQGVNLSIETDAGGSPTPFVMHATSVTMQVGGTQYSAFVANEDGSVNIGDPFQGRSTFTNTGAFLVPSSITASAFFGDASHLSNLSAAFPIGTIVRSTAAITGGTWLQTDGSTLSQSTYASLFGTIGHAYMAYSHTFVSSVAFSGNSSIVWNGTYWGWTNNTTFAYSDGVSTGTAALANTGTANSGALTSYNTNGTMIDAGPGINANISLNYGVSWSTHSFPVAVNAAINIAPGNTSSTFLFVTTNTANVYTMTAGATSWLTSAGVLPFVPSKIGAVWWDGSNWNVADAGNSLIYQTAVAAGTSGWTAAPQNQSIKSVFSGSLTVALTNGKNVISVPQGPYIHSSTNSLATINNYPTTLPIGVQAYVPYWNGTVWVLFNFSGGTTPTIAISADGTQGNIVSSGVDVQQNSTLLNASTNNLMNTANGKFLLIANYTSSISEALLYAPAPNTSTQFSLPFIPGSYIRAQ